MTFADGLILMPAAEAGPAESIPICDAPNLTPNDPVQVKSRSSPKEST